jgi:Glyoxalase-like domain
VARIRDVVFDSRHPASLARFWASVLEDYQVAPYDQAELDRLHAAGIDDPEDDPTVLVEPLADSAPRLWFQWVAESKLVKNRVHLDLTATDTGAEVERLTGLGARVLARQERWVTMADPEGNEFDVMAG